MATVKILFSANTEHVEKYMKNKMEVEGPTTERDCKLERMTSDFKAMQSIHGSSGNTGIHIIQSWSPIESKSLSREQVHEMGIKLVERFAPGHQFVIQTHTEEAHSHNHIVLNPVSFETGKRIQNKKHHLGELRNLNDDIAREHNLSVLPQQDPHRKKSGLSDKVKRIDNYRGKSYIVDLANKADFSRHYATNYDEYLAILNSLDIEARIEPKNITYFYPGKTHGKRGAHLKDTLDKPGLEKKFQLNLEKYNQSPELRRNLSELTREFRSKETPTSVSVHSTASIAELVSKRSEGVSKPRLDELAKSLIPIEEIQKAKTQSILRYCDKEGIKISTGTDGKKHLQGRDYVEVADYSWINHKNKTRGNVIDFVANHQDCGFLQAISKINNNRKLLLLEQYLGEPPKTYQSFHVPKENAAPRSEALLHLGRLIGHSRSHPVYSELFKQQLIHVGKNGAVAFLQKKSSDGYIEYLPESNGSYRHSKTGQVKTLFLNPPKKSSDIYLFLDPRELLKQSPNSIGKQASYPVAALFEPNLEMVHQMVAAQPQLKKLKIMAGEVSRAAPGILTFFQELKKSLDPFSIETELVWDSGRKLEIQKIHDRDLGMGREI
jgi:hypothetical protein